VKVVCCQVEVFATGRFLVQKSSIECVCLSVIRCNNNPLHRWFPQLAPRIPRDPQSVPRGPVGTFLEQLFGSLLYFK